MSDENLSNLESQKTEKTFKRNKIIVIGLLLLLVISFASVAIWQLTKSSGKGANSVTAQNSSGSREQTVSSRNDFGSSRDQTSTSRHPEGGSSKAPGIAKDPAGSSQPRTPEGGSSNAPGIAKDPAGSSQPRTPEGGSSNAPGITKDPAGSSQPRTPEGGSSNAPGITKDPAGSSQPQNSSTSSSTGNKTSTGTGTNPDPKPQAEAQKSQTETINSVKSETPLNQSNGASSEVSGSGNTSTLNGTSTNIIGSQEGTTSVTGVVNNTNNGQESKTTEPAKTDVKLEPEPESESKSESEPKPLSETPPTVQNAEQKAEEVGPSGTENVNKTNSTQETIEDTSKLDKKSEDKVSSKSERIFFTSNTVKNKGKFFSVAADGSDMQCHTDKPVSNAEITIFSVSKTKPPIFAYERNNDIYIFDSGTGQTKMVYDGAALRNEFVSIANIDISPDGKHLAFMSNLQSGIMNFIDISKTNNDSPDTSSTGFLSHYFRYSQDGSKLFILNPYDRKLYAIGSADKKISNIGQFNPLKGNPIISPDGKKICDYTDKSITILSLDQEAQTVKFEDEESRIYKILSWSEDSSEIFFTIMCDEDILLEKLSLDNMKFVQMKSEDGKPIRINTSLLVKTEDIPIENSEADSQSETESSTSTEAENSGKQLERIYFSKYYGDKPTKIFSIAIDGTRFRCDIENLPAKPINSLVSSKTEPPVLVYSVDNLAYILNLGEESPTPQLLHNDKVFKIAISPNGEQIAVIPYENNQKHKIQVFDVASRGKKYEKDFKSYVTDIEYSPEGDKILSKSAISNKVFEMNSNDGSDCNQIFEFAKQGVAGKISPDRKNYLIFNVGAKSVSAYRCKENSSEWEMINEFKMSGLYSFMSWSSDGSRAFFNDSNDNILKEYCFDTNQLTTLKDEKGNAVKINAKIQ